MRRALLSCVTGRERNVLILNRVEIEIEIEIGIESEIESDCEIEVEVETSKTCSSERSLYFVGAFECALSQRSVCVFVCLYVR